MAENVIPHWAVLQRLQDSIYFDRISLLTVSTPIGKCILKGKILEVKDEQLWISIRSGKIRLDLADVLEVNPLSEAAELAE